MEVVKKEVHGPPPDQIDYRFWGKEPSEKNLNSDYATVSNSSCWPIIGINSVDDNSVPLQHHIERIYGKFVAN